MQADAIVHYLEKITRFDTHGFTPLYFGAQQRLGYVNADWKQKLLVSEPTLFREQQQKLHCLLRGSYHHRTSTLAHAAHRWRRAGWLNTWRNENFTIFGMNGRPYFELERAAFRPLGLTSCAVHINGLSRLASGEVKMWVGRRSPFKEIDASRVDNMVGGGVAAGESLLQALVRESWEEAGIPHELLQHLSPQSLLLAERLVPRGLHREWLYAFDLWLPLGVVPCNQDGEMSGHSLFSLAEVEQLLIGERFMIDAALACIDCLERLAYWQGDNHIITNALTKIRHKEAFDVPSMA
ncbi:DUF4743 domain-containing protein [Neisseriaceae bacterium TC5R-5]|nr:DUF4743 domain-containing protein [Neisseriaceae bacterium TC5R-5]